MPADFDIAVIGSGFGGALMSLICRRLGKSVIMLEKGEHPRFAIGESSTPLANLTLEELARRWDFPRLRPLAKWGTWQKAYPEVACGLKRGFSFFHHPLGASWKLAGDHRNELLVAASPRDEIGDTHWYREHVDNFLVKEAINEGTEYLDHVSLAAPEFMGDLVRLSGSRDGKPLRVQVRFLIDASGPAGFLHRNLKIPSCVFPTMPPTQGLYTHFEDVCRFADLHPHAQPPYPIDDAAVHHLFAGGWIWVLRFKNGITSAGVAATETLAQQLDFSTGAKAWEKLLALLPSVREQFQSARAVQPFVHSARLSFRSNHVSGPRWTMLPHTTGFVDPLLSTGIALNLLGIERLAETIGLRNASRFESHLQNHSTKTLAELDFTALIVSALYANLHDFEMFAALSRLYFAAASFSETLRRLGRPSQGFLLNENWQFASAVREICNASLKEKIEPHVRSSLLAKIRVVIEPFDIAGLNDSARRNWHPVLAEDLLTSRAKLGASESDIHEMLKKAGF